MLNAAVVKLPKQQAYAVLETTEDAEKPHSGLYSDLLVMQRTPPACWTAPLFGVVAKTAICSILLGLAVVVAVGCARQHPDHTSSITCLHALGGGSSSRGGGFDVAMVTDPICKMVLLHYLKPGGLYWKEVQLAADKAKQYFQTTHDVGSNLLIVFDIDETVLSNIGTFIESGYSAGFAAKKETTNRLSPPIPPMLELFRYLYRSGYTLTFITGRNEQSRNQTVRNLEAAGYGKQCSSVNGTLIRTEEPCYLQLDLRTMDDDRFASVYKPERRGLLKEQGWEIVGSFGDQFSDLEGSNGAVASFKLPNPMYYIL